MFDDGRLRPGGSSRNRPHGHLGVLRVAVLALFAVLTLRLVEMQIVDGKGYEERSKNNHIAQTNLLPPRGLMTDRNGTPLVQNVPVYSVTIVPDLLPEGDAARYAVYLALARPQMTGVPALEIQQRVLDAITNDDGDQAIAIKKYLTKEQALAIEEASVDMPGVAIEIQPGRKYIAGPAFSHIIGHIGSMEADDWAELQDEGYLLNEPIGKAGLEARYEEDLRGTVGVSANEQDAQGRLIEVLETQDAEPGNTLQLAIDAGLQTFVAELLENALQDAQNAAAVVMNAKTGEVYALVSLPTYDNNIYSQPTDENARELTRLTKDPRKPFLNWALNPAAPGSTFKILTAAAALQEGHITPGTRQYAPKILYVKGVNDELYPLVDWRDHGGSLNLYEAIAWSSNIYFYRASCGILGETRGISEERGEIYKDAVILGNYARDFGFGSPSGIDIDGETDGRVPSPEWKRRNYSGPEYTEQDRDWVYGDTCNMGIGQGDVLATPMQIARMTAAVANGGTLVTPHLVNSVVTPDGKPLREVRPNGTKVDVDPQHLAVIREGMHQSVLNGAGALARQNTIDIAGKTGTAEFFESGTGIKREHAWFTGFYPFDDPEVVVTVYFDLGVGGNKAAPVAGKIFKYFSENVTP